MPQMVLRVAWHQVAETFRTIDHLVKSCQKRLQPCSINMAFKSPPHQGDLAQDAEVEEQPDVAASLVVLASWRALALSLSLSLFLTLSASLCLPRSMKYHVSRKAPKHLCTPTVLAILDDETGGTTCYGHRLLSLGCFLRRERHQPHYL